jgi:hypothetical protein
MLKAFNKPLIVFFAPNFSWTPRYMVSSLLIKAPLFYKYIVSLTKQDCFTMNNKDFTIPKNLLLNWLYSTERNVSLDELGKWLENNTSGQYKLVKNNIKTEAA